MVSRQNAQLLPWFHEQCEKHGILYTPEDCFAYMHELPERLRFARAGAGFVKVTHQIYMGVCIIHLVFFGYSVFDYLQDYLFTRGMAEGSQNMVLGLDISMISYRNLKRSR